jgi:hypothetical protein
LKEGAEKAFKTAQRAFMNVFCEGARVSPVPEAVGIVFRVATNLHMLVVVLPSVYDIFTIVIKVKAKSIKIKMILPEALAMSA